MRRNLQDEARSALLEYLNRNAADKEPKDLIRFNDIFIVWFCKTLQNWKALAATEGPDDTYYELTFNGDKNELYIDAYRKTDNTVLYNGPVAVAA